MKTPANSREGDALDKDLARHGSVPVRDQFTAQPRPLPGTQEDRVARAMADADKLAGRPLPLRSAQ